jgi:hypothetical protein
MPKDQKCFIITQSITSMSLFYKHFLVLTVFAIDVYIYTHLFFVGRVLNRFTKDVAIMDDSLPTDAFDFIDVSRPSVIHMYFLVV